MVAGQVGFTNYYEELGVERGLCFMLLSQIADRDEKVKGPVRRPCLVRCTAKVKGHDWKMEIEIPDGYFGWWRIIETSQWDDAALDLIGPALISFTGDDDRLRMLALLARLNCIPTKTGLSFIWQGAWEYDPCSGSGEVELLENGDISGWIKINDGDESTFIARRAEEPDVPIPVPPSYRDKWRRRW